MIGNTRGATQSPSLPSRLRTAATGIVLLALGGPVVAASLVDELGGVDQRDRERANAAIQEALEHSLSEQATFWSNVASGTAGVVKPLRTYRTSGGYFCRVYSEHITMPDSRRLERTATACRTAEGIWQNVQVN